jgi:O-acetyl-ADP-ribose deacetylase (regulator of RNase III)
LTTAGRLPFKAIIHVAGISLLWRSSERSIRDSVRNAMAIAQQRTFQSVAIPLIGAGSGGGNPHRIQTMIEDELTRCPFDGEVRVVRYSKVLANPRVNPCGGSVGF